jgi:tetratricopeptide (TPR) repeat protein
MSALRFAAIGTLLLALAASACSRSTSDEATPPVDTELMAFLSEARALHHEATMKEQNGDLPGAIAALDRLAAARRPRHAPEVEEVLADTFARLGELHLENGDVGHANDAIRQGLEHAPEATYFRGHLLEVEGLVEEARAASYADAGDAIEAQRAREKAIALLEEVVRIQDQVIQRSLARRAEAGR